MFKNKAITLSLLLILLLPMIAYFAYTNYLFRGFNVNQSLSSIKQSAEQGNWTVANSEFDALDQFWEDSKFLLQLNNGDQSFSELGAAFKNLSVSLQQKQAFETFLYANQIERHLDNQLKVIPEP
jgi:hypothetical protein